MATATNERANREWVATEFSKGIDAEQALMEVGKARVQSPPDETLAVLYQEIATADARHKQIVETIATRYGHTPTRGVTGSIGETLGRLKDKVGEMGATGIHLLGSDLAAKANAIHWYTAWVAAFESLGDTESASQLAAVMTEEKAHRDALQTALNRMITLGARAIEIEPTIPKE